MQNCLIDSLTKLLPAQRTNEITNGKLMPGMKARLPTDDTNPLWFSETQVLGAWCPKALFWNPSGWVPDFELVLERKTSTRTKCKFQRY